MCQVGLGILRIIGHTASLHNPMLGLSHRAWTIDVFRVLRIDRDLVAPSTDQLHTACCCQHGLAQLGLTCLRCHDAASAQGTELACQAGAELGPSHWVRNQCTHAGSKFKHKC